MSAVENNELERDVRHEEIISIHKRIVKNKFRDYESMLSENTLDMYLNDNCQI